MKTPITYYGGKQEIAEHIIKMFPQHTIYCEPFFGGGAVFFKKEKSRCEVINDIDDNLINFYSTCQLNFQALKTLIDGTLNSESQYRYAKDIWNNRIPSNEIEKAWAIWLITNGSFGGSMHGGWKWSNFSSGSHTGIYLENKRNSFTEKLQDRLKNVQITCRDAIKVIQDRDSTETLFYLDPPYPGSNQGHYKGYTHKDLCNLLETLCQIKGKFILSNYWSQSLKYYILLKEWNFEKIPVKSKVSNMSGRNLHRTEILVYNFKLKTDLFNTHGNSIQLQAL